MYVMLMVCSGWKFTFVYWAGFCQLPSNKTYQRIQDNQTIELTWMCERFPQVTFKIFLTTSWISNHLRIMAIFLNGVSNWSQSAFLINRNKTSTFPALGCQFKSCWLFLSFFLFSCFGFFPFLTYFLSVWRFFEKCISTIKIDWLYRKSSKVLKFFERNFFKNFWKKSGVGPEKTADIWWYYHWFPHHMTSETSAEIPYWWRVTTQIWVVLLIGCVAWEIWFNQWEALPRSGSFGGETSGSIAKCQLFNSGNKKIWLGRVLSVKTK